MGLYVGKEKFGSHEAIKAESGDGIKLKEIDDQGVLRSVSGAIKIDCKDIPDFGLTYAFYNSTGITSMDLSSLTQLSGNRALSNAFYNCTNFSFFNLSNLTEIKGTYALYYAFAGTDITSADFGKLEVVPLGISYVFSRAFSSCLNLSSVDFSRLKELRGSNVFYSAFSGCTGLKTLSFPSLHSKSFTGNTSQFDSMLSGGVTGCTVHFPSNLESVIGSWTSVTSGFGGTNTVVLFDLPATT